MLTSGREAVSERVGIRQQLEARKSELREANARVARLVAVLKEENDAGRVTDSAARRILFATFNLASDPVPDNGNENL